MTVREMRIHQSNPFAGLDGCVSENGLIFGTYLHGLFHNIEFTRRLLTRLRQIHGLPATETKSINQQEMYDKLADIIRNNLDMSQIYETMESKCTLQHRKQT